MKKFINIVIVGLLLVSCSGGGDDTPPTPVVENKNPTTPALVAPTNNKLCIDNSVSFQWNASTDPEGDAITYQFQLAKDNQFNQIAHNYTGSSTNQSISLEKGVAYYWRVKSLDSKNASSNYSSVYNFYTEGVGVSNHLPFAPEIVLPTLNSSVQSGATTLVWNASDVDTSDVLSYDVYFGTVNPPIEKIANNQLAKTININLVTSTNYYWKVVVKDGKGGETVGQIWNFKSN